MSDITSAADTVLEALPAYHIEAAEKALDFLVAAAERADAAEREWKSMYDQCRDERDRVVAAEAKAATLAEQIAAIQPKTLAMIRANGFVFDSIGNEPGNWQHLAFTIYTDLCEADSIARAALAAGAADSERWTQEELDEIDRAVAERKKLHGWDEPAGGTEETG